MFSLDEALPTAHDTDVVVTPEGLTWRTPCGRDDTGAVRLPWKHARRFCRPCNKCLARRS